MREKVPDADARLELLAPLGFGKADVVVAAPQAWIDVRIDGRSRGRRVGLSREARRADAGRDQIRQPDPPLFRGSRRRRLPDRREPRRDRGRAGGRGGRADRRHHHHRRDARGQCAETPGGRADPALAGDAGRLARRAPGGRRSARAPASSSTGSRPPRKRARPARCARECRSRRTEVFEEARRRFGAVPAFGEARRSARASSRSIAPRPTRPISRAGSSSRAPSASASSRSSTCSTRVTRCTRRWRRGSAACK